MTPIPAPTPTPRAGQSIRVPGHVAAAQALGMAGHVRADLQTTAAAIEAFVATP